MKRSNTSGFGLWCSGLLSVVALGCGGQADEPTGEADPSGDIVTNDDELRTWRRPWSPRPPATGGTGVVTPPRGGTGGTTGGTSSGSGGSPSTDVDCDVCATAQACCNTVSGAGRDLQSASKETKDAMNGR